MAGRAGVDTIDGGAGVDTASYDGEMDGVTVTLGVNGVETLGKGGFAQGDKIKNIENLQGSDGADVLTGNALDNNIFGGDGGDTIDGGLGNDVLDAWFSLEDTLTYANTAGSVTVNLSILTAQNTGGSGIDTIAGFEHLTGGKGNDTLTGNILKNTILGGDGNDTIEGGAEADILDGQGNGAAGDTISYASANSFTGVPVTVDLATLTVSGGDADGDTISNFENIVGSNWNDTLTGDGKANTIFGGNGSDLIKGGAGADILDGGGAPGDTVSFEGSPLAVTVTLGDGSTQTTVTGPLGSDGAGDKIKNFENIIGTAGNDVLTGNSDLNTLHGGDGNDVIDGGADQDDMYGEGGIDTLSYASSAFAVKVDLSQTFQFIDDGMTITEITDGFENLTGSAHNDKLLGDMNANTLMGGAGNDKIDGGAGDDILDGGAGTGDIATYQTAAASVTVDLSLTIAQDTKGAGIDTLTGFEILTGSAHNDKLTGGGGNDTLNGEFGEDTIFGEGGNDTLNGGDGKDTISGGGGNDTINGGSFDDTIDGGAGNDTISGGVSIDTLTGGLGSDRFAFANPTSDGDADFIMDFSSAEGRQAPHQQGRLWPCLPALQSAVREPTTSRTTLSKEPAPVDPDEAIRVRHSQRHAVFSARGAR